MHHRVLYLILLLTTPLISQSSIRGTAPDAYRNQIVHLDILDDHLDVVTIADYQLLSQTNVDSSGHFDFGTLVLPEGQSLYRLRYRMRQDPPVSMNFLQRHYLTFVIGEGDSLTIDSLSLVAPSPINLALCSAERGTDQYHSVSIATGSDRQTTEVDQLRRDYLRSILHNQKIDPYSRVYAFGKLGTDQPSAADVLAADEALGNTKLPASYRRMLDRELGAFAYHRLRHQNTWLMVALSISVIVCSLFGYLLFRQRKESETVEANVSSPAAELTDKEREVFDLVSQGRSNCRLPLKRTS